jgi:AraC family transcriptional activator of pobA
MPSSFIELQTFYKHINQASGPVQEEIGHFNIFRIEDILQPTLKQSTTYSRRNFFKISLITGHNKLHYADQSIEIDGSALVFTNPLVPYLWERISEAQSGYVCVFTEAFLSRFGPVREYPVFQFADTAIIPLSPEEMERFKTQFVSMSEELHGDYVYKYDLLRNLVMEVIHRAQKMQPAAGNVPAGSNAAERITGLFAELLERQFPIEFSNQVIQLHAPADFAAQLRIHVNHLNKALKEITGRTTSQLIAERILQEAKILLKSTNWAIAEIASCLGFEEPNHFSSFFKTREKVTPNKFRQARID